MYVTGGIRRLAKVAGEMNDAVRRMTGPRLGYDVGQDLNGGLGRGVGGRLGRGTPDDPGELLLRRAARLVHEPSAAERAAGECVR